MHIVLLVEVIKCIDSSICIIVFVPEVLWVKC